MASTASTTTTTTVAPITTTTNAATAAQIADAVSQKVVDTQTSSQQQQQTFTESSDMISANEIQRYNKYQKVLGGLTEDQLERFKDVAIKGLENEEKLVNEASVNIPTFIAAYNAHHQSSSNPLKINEVSKMVEASKKLNDYKPLALEVNHITHALNEELKRNEALTLQIRNNERTIEQFNVATQQQGSKLQQRTSTGQPPVGQQQSLPVDNRQQQNKHSSAEARRINNETIAKNLTQVYSKNGHYENRLLKSDDGGSSTTTDGSEKRSLDNNQYADQAFYKRLKDNKYL